MRSALQKEHVGTRGHSFKSRGFCRLPFAFFRVRAHRPRVDVCHRARGGIIPVDVGYPARTSRTSRRASSSTSEVPGSR